MFQNCLSVISAKYTSRRDPSTVAHVTSVWTREIITASSQVSDGISSSIISCQLVPEYILLTGPTKLFGNEVCKIDGGPSAEDEDRSHILQT